VTVAALPTSDAWLSVDLSYHASTAEITACFDQVCGSFYANRATAVTEFCVGYRSSTGGWIYLDDVGAYGVVSP
jgi:hypothetical protein